MTVNPPAPAHVLPASPSPSPSLPAQHRRLSASPGVRDGAARGVPQPQGCRAPRGCAMPPSWVSPGPSQQRGTLTVGGSGHAPSSPQSWDGDTEKLKFLHFWRRAKSRRDAGRDAAVAHAPAPRRGGRTCATQPMLPAKLLATSPGVQPASGVPGGQRQGPPGLGSHLQQRPPMSPLAENARPSCAVVHCQQWGDREGGGGRINSLKKKIKR